MDDKERKLAVALKYDQQTDAAPRVLATGQGKMAEQIVARAEAAQVPVQEQADLAKSLIKLDVGQMIPPELYVAVAEILAYIYQLDNNYVKKPQK